MIFFFQTEYPQEEGNVLGEQPTSSCHKGEMNKVAEGSKPRELEEQNMQRYRSA